MFNISIFILFVSLWTPHLSFAQSDFSIFEVRRQLAMSNTDKTFKDFYIHAGTDDGVKEGQVYDVIRKVPLYDSFRNRALGSLSIKVAKVQVIFTDKNISVARFHQDFSRQGIPVLDDNFILIGDSIDLKSAAKTTSEVPSEPENQAANSPVQVVINSIDVSAQVLESR